MDSPWNELVTMVIGTFSGYGMAMVGCGTGNGAGGRPAAAVPLWPHLFQIILTRKENP